MDTWGQGDKTERDSDTRDGDIIGGVERQGWCREWTVRGQSDGDVKD